MKKLDSMRESFWSSKFDLPGFYVVDMNLEKLYALKLNAHLSVRFKVQLRKGTFFNYVDKRRWVGSRSKISTLTS